MNHQINFNLSNSLIHIAGAFKPYKNTHLRIMLEVCWHFFTRKLGFSWPCTSLTCLNLLHFSLFGRFFFINVYASSKISWFPCFYFSLSSQVYKTVSSMCTRGISMWCRWWSCGPFTLKIEIMNLLFQRNVCCKKSNKS